MTGMDARVTALGHAVQMQLGIIAAGGPQHFDVVGHAKQFAEFLDPAPRAAAAAPKTRIDLDGEGLRYYGNTRTWAFDQPHCYEVRLQSAERPGDTVGLIVQIAAPCIADAIHQAEEKHPGYIAREVRDVS